VTTLHATFIGTATVLLELNDGPHCLRLLTDPVFDQAGTTHRVGGLRALEYTSLHGPALEPAALPPIDAVLLSHDHHGDNLDRAGRGVARGARQIFTTRAGAKRLRRAGLSQAEGLSPWASVELSLGARRVRVTATPARHGPRWSLPFVGPVIGFLIEWADHARSAVWISGDTLWHRALEPLADRDVGFALLHVGQARFAPFRSLRYSMNATDVSRAVACLSPHTICPIHFDGWSHFTQGRDQLEAALIGLKERLLWLPPAQPLELRPP
jgi:L-ascorbate metabolism protein UlaG (beta-lactamase superfamily)